MKIVMNLGQGAKDGGKYRLGYFHQTGSRAKTERTFAPPNGNDP
jgi:hypothetical protein